MAKNLIRIAIVLGIFLIPFTIIIAVAAKLTPITGQPRLLEAIKGPIPGFIIERYAVNFKDVSGEVSKSYKTRLGKWISQPEFKEAFTPVYLWERQCGLSFAGIDKIRPGRGAEFFYFNGNENLFYADILDTIPSFPYFPNLYGGSGSYPGAHLSIRDEDARISKGQAVITEMINDISCNGKILYTISVYKTAKRTGAATFLGDREHAIILADIPNATKTVIGNIRDNADGMISKLELTDDGSKLIISFSENKNFKKGIYLIDLKTWRTQFYLPELDVEVFFNEDASLLYLHLSSAEKENSIGYIYNTLTGEKTVVQWPVFLTSYRHIASRNLRYIARLLGIFSAPQWSEGQFGIVVQTPVGQFIISSPERSFVPKKICDDGTIYTDRKDVFKFEGGTYKLFKTGDGKPVEVKIRKWK